MITIAYTGLFEDEVAEVLRDHPLRDTLIFSGHYMFAPACMLCDDGIYTSGSGYFTEYMHGQRTGNHITASRLTQVLAHRPFTIKVREG